jgi:hypothetical protein
MAHLLNVITLAGEVCSGELKKNFLIFVKEKIDTEGNDHKKF